ncbi:MAG TPA: hypothetical protein VFR81_22335 [Longimicrobium sp.]|nr:hypothetical protein [Longimicrobium sp.]
MTMVRRCGWLLLALAACGDGDGAERTEARVDSAAAPAAAAPAPAPPAAPAIAVEGGRFASDVQGLPVNAPAGSARFCAGGSSGTGFGLVLLASDKYAVHLYRLAGRPAPGLYRIVPMSQQENEFATADGFFLSDAGGAAVPLVVMPGGEVLVESSDPTGVSGTVRLPLRTHLQSNDEANSLPVSPQNPAGFNLSEKLGTVTLSFKAVDGGSCNAINEELMADVPEALRAPAQP